MDDERQAAVRAVGSAVQAYQRSTDAFDDVVSAYLGINRTDLRCLDWLFEGPRTVGQLARETGLSSAAATTLVDRLERKGFVRRIRDTTDRRRIGVELKPQALELIGQVYGPLVADGGDLLERYSAPQLALLRAYLDASTDLTEQHRRRIAELPRRVAGGRRRAGTKTRRASGTP